MVDPLLDCQIGNIQILQVTSNIKRIPIKLGGGKVRRPVPHWSNLLGCCQCCHEKTLRFYTCS